MRKPMLVRGAPDRWHDSAVVGEICSSPRCAVVLHHRLPHQPNNGPAERVDVLRRQTPRNCRGDTSRNEAPFIGAVF